MIKASGLALSLLTALAIVFAHGTGHAANPQFCDSYAKQAFKAAKLNNQFNCGFQGPRWLLDVNGHRFWCSIASEAQANAETSARASEMSGCVCNWYADTAMAQVKENKQRNCGFNGLRWIDSRQGHHDWCKSFNPGLPAMKGEIATRKAMLAQQC
jgi:hypothetical protein